MFDDYLRIQGRYLHGKFVCRRATEKVSRKTSQSLLDTNIFGKIGVGWDFMTHHDVIDFIQLKSMTSFNLNQ